MLFFIVFNPLCIALLFGFFGRYIGYFGILRFLKLFILFNIFGIVYCFYMVLNSTISIISFNIWSWFYSGFLQVNWSFIVDDLTLIMLVVVSCISYVVHLYSFKYMFFDPHLLRFMSYLSLFTFFMLLLIVSDNLIILFFGWEGVGICSYLLISFWYTRIQANKSALKAVFVNRISDFLLTFGFIILFNFILTVDFSIIFALCGFIDNSSIWIFNLQVSLVTIVSFFFFAGAVGKSAQIVLHTWLPDAMEGPTPVSALIHAATMVTAGVFLIIRVSFIMEYSITVLSVIAYVGVFTSVFAATSGLMLLDIKKVIAYSTCSQLGYMIFSCGLSAYNISLFHLMNHAFFKALLFLGAGAVIHSLNNEQDMRRMGNLFKILPLSYNALLIASLAITGFPFLTGFYSKDILLETSTVAFGSLGFFVQWMAFFTAFFTAFYSFKIIFLVFFNNTNVLRNTFFKVHESPFEIALVLILLIFGSIFCGFFFRDLIVGFGSLFLSNSIYVSIKNVSSSDFEFIFTILKMTPLFLGVFGISVYFIFVFFLRRFMFIYTRFFSLIFKFLVNQWYFNKLYNYYINSTFLYIAKMWIYKLLDKGLFEIYGPLGVWKVLNNFKVLFKCLESGNISFYAYFLVFPVFLIFYMICCDFFFLNSSMIILCIFFKRFQKIVLGLKNFWLAAFLNNIIIIKCFKVPLQNFKDKYRNEPKKHLGNIKFGNASIHIISYFIIGWIIIFDCLLDEIGVSLNMRYHLKIIYFDVYWCIIFYYAWWRLNIFYCPMLRKLYFCFKKFPYFESVPYWVIYFFKILIFIEYVFFTYFCGFFYYSLLYYKRYISYKMQSNVLLLFFYLNFIFLFTHFMFMF